MDAHQEAREFVRAMRPGPLKEVLSEVIAWSSGQILRCLDPRHGTTHEQAVEAVYEHPLPTALLEYVRSCRCVCNVGTQPCSVHLVGHPGEGELMSEWFIVHEPTGQIVGAVMATRKPDFLRPHCSAQTEEELLASDRGRRLLESYEFWEKRS